MLFGCGEEEKTSRAKSKKETTTTQKTSDTTQTKMQSTDGDASANTPLDMLLGAMVAEHPGFGDIELAMNAKDSKKVEEILTKITGADDSKLVQTPAGQLPELQCPEPGKTLAVLIHQDWYATPNQSLNVASSSEFVAFASKEGDGEKIVTGACDGTLDLSAAEPVAVETLKNHEVVQSNEMLKDLVSKIAAAPNGM